MTSSLLLVRQQPVLAALPATTSLLDEEGGCIVEYGTNDGVFLLFAGQDRRHLDD